MKCVVAARKEKPASAATNFYTPKWLTFQLDHRQHTAFSTQFSDPMKLLAASR